MNRSMKWGGPLLRAAVALGAVCNLVVTVQRFSKGYHVDEIGQSSFFHQFWKAIQIH